MTFLRVSSPRIANLEDVGNGCALNYKWGRDQGEGNDVIYQMLPRAPVYSGTALGEDGGDATSFSLEDTEKVIFLSQSRDSSMSFVLVEGAWTWDFSAPFTGNWVAAAVIALGKAVPSFLTFVKMYENQDGLDSPPHLFFIRNKHNQSFYLGQHIP